MAESLLAELRSAGVRLWVEGGRLGFDGAVTDAQVGRMRARREELLALIRAPAVDPVAAAPGLRPVVVHLKRDRFDVRIDRRSKWGNPFKVGSGGDRAEVIAKYRSWILGRSDLMAALPELSGKRLGCWCAPLPCHGDVLADLVEQLTPAGLMDSAAPAVLADPAPGGSSVTSSIVCPWCRSADLVDEPEGIRCRGCDRLAWLDLPGGGWERVDRAELDLVEVDPDSVPVCPGCGRLFDVFRGPMAGSCDTLGPWACSRCDPEADRRRVATDRWAGLARRMIGLRAASASRPSGESAYRDRLPASVGAVDDPVAGESCPRCGSVRSHVVPVHGGESLRRDCSGCGRFLGNPVWHDAAAVDAFVAVLKTGSRRRAR